MPSEKPRRPKKQRPLFAGEPAPEVEEIEPVQNQLSNEETSRIFMQIFRAKGLANGITLSISDDTIQVFGQVKSEAAKREILSLLDKGRGQRKIEDSNLIVGN